MSGFHSRMSPSSLERLLTCPASYFASQGKSLPSKAYTALGTAAHSVHEQCLRNGRKAADYVLDTVVVVEHDRTWDILVDDAMAAAVQESLDVCNAIDGYTFVEKRVDTTAYCPLPDQSGTADFIVIDHKRKTLHVRDYKHGEGVRVDVYCNPQLIYYALGALHDLCDVFEIEKVVLGIHQPRLDNVSLWTSTPAELHAMGTFFKSQLTRCLDSTAPYVPTVDACRFCANKFDCKAREEQAKRLTQGMLNDLDEVRPDAMTTEWPDSMPDIDMLTLDDLLIVYKHTEMVTGFLRDVKTDLLRRALHGESLPGHKLVAGRANRKWVDDTAERNAANHLIRSGVAPSRVLKIERPSPAAAERLLPKSLRGSLGEWIVKPPGRPTIVPEDDPRSAYNPVGIDVFDDLDAETGE